MDLSFLKINVDKIGLKLKSIFSAKVNIEVDKRKTEIGILQNIKEEKNLDLSTTNNNHLTVLIASPNSLKEIQKTFENFGVKDNLLLPESPDATGEAEIPEVTVENEAKKSLKEWLSEYKKNNTFLLDTGRLLFIYEHRLDIEFTEEELVFLVKSSIKRGFPVWFWSFFYREKYGHVIPLFKSVFYSEDLKIRLGVVDALLKFSGVADAIVELAQTEKDEVVLGAIVVQLHKNKDQDRAQQVIANAISRRLIPQLDYKDVRTLVTELGKSEIKYLYQTIENGWSNERIKALNILSLTASESDLAFLESILTGEVYRDSFRSTLHCIVRIGKTNISEYFRKELKEARSESWFMPTLEVVVATKDRDALPDLFEYLKDYSGLASRFSYDIDSWKLRTKLKEAITSLMDKDFYEEIVKDILSYSDYKRRDLYVWRQFDLLEDIKNEELIEIIKNDERLKTFPEEYEKLVKALTSNNNLENKDAKELTTLATTNDYWNAMLYLRKVWKIIPQEESLNYQEKIEEFKTDLNKRLDIFAKGDFPEEIKTLAQKGLDYFVGENDTYNRYGNPVFKSEKIEENEDFKKLLKDIDLFDKIEGEYINFILKEKNEATKQFLIKNLGRPYKTLYNVISKDWSDLKEDEIKDKLMEIIRGSENPLLIILATSATQRFGITEEDISRIIITNIVIEAKNKLRESGRRRKDVDEWLIHHITYYGGINALSDIGNIEDLPLIDEAINTETTLYRTFNQYEGFHNVKSFERLISMLETTTNTNEKKNVSTVMDNIDYYWTKKVLNIES